MQRTVEIQSVDMDFFFFENKLIETFILVCSLARPTYFLAS